MPLPEGESLATLPRCQLAHILLMPCPFVRLQNKTSLTQVIKEAYYKTQEEYERFCLQAPVKNIEECYDLIERTVEGNNQSKPHLYRELSP